MIYQVRLDIYYSEDGLQCETVCHRFEERVRLFRHHQLYYPVLQEQTAHERLLSENARPQEAQRKISFNVFKPI